MLLSYLSTCRIQTQYDELTRRIVVWACKDPEDLSKVAGMLSCRREADSLLIAKLCSIPPQFRPVDDRALLTSG
jgi:hypothetical protein